MNIRPFRKGDTQAVVALIEEFLGYAEKNYSKNVKRFNQCVDKRKYAQHILQSFLNNKAKMLVAVDDEVKGYIAGKAEKNPHMHKSGHVISFFVTKQYRNKGMGRLLFTKLCDWFRTQNCYQLELDIFEGNDDAKRMYKRWGFKEISTKMKIRIK